MLAGVSVGLEGGSSSGMDGVEGAVEDREVLTGTVGKIGAK